MGRWEHSEGARACDEKAHGGAARERARGESRAAGRALQGRTADRADSGLRRALRGRAAGFARTATSRAFAAFLALAFALACLGALPHAAWAAEGESANHVDPQLLPDSSFIYDTSIVDLSQADSYFDGQTVRVTGEVVGDRRQELGDQENCWITLTDPAYDVNNTVEIYLSNEQASRIDSYGAYGRMGSIVSIQGTFHLVCAEHDGASDVHADTISVSSRGSEVAHPFDAMAFVPGLVACGVGLLMMVALWYLRERGR